MDTRPKLNVKIMPSRHKKNIRSIYFASLLTSFYMMGGCYTNTMSMVDLGHIYIGIREVKLTKLIPLKYGRGAFRTLSNIKDEVICENSLRLKAFNYFRKKFHFRCLAGF